MSRRTVSQLPNHPGDALPDGESFITWPIVWVLAWTLGVAAAVPTVWVNPMMDLDGLGNRVLVENMAWPVSHYSARGTGAKDLPFFAYQKEVFPQPPGYVAFLKLFADWAGSAKEANAAARTVACQSSAYLLHAAALLIYIAAMTRWCRAHGYGVVVSGVAMITIAVCPILVANTVWLRADGISAYLAVASLLLLTSEDDPRWSTGVVAGLTGGLALLMHTSALRIVPLAVLIYGLSYQQARTNKSSSFSFRPLAIFLGIALAMSGWHYVRFFAAGGPGGLPYKSPLDDAPEGASEAEIFRYVFRRSAVELIPEWLVTAPVLAALLAIVPQGRAMLAGEEQSKRGGDRWITATVLVIFIDFALRWIWGGSYQLRFCSLWAAMLAPAMVACYYRCSPSWRSWAGGLAVVTLFFQIAGCVPAASFIGEPAYVTPAPAYMLRPWLNRYLPISKMSHEEEADQP